MNKQQPKALELAELWEARATYLQTWIDEDDYVEFGYRPEGLKKEQADQKATAAELRRLHEVNQELLSFVHEYIEAWKEGMAEDSYLLRIAEALITKAQGDTL